MNHPLPDGIPPIPEGRLSIHEVRRMPSFSGVYFAFDEDGSCHYVGESVDVTSRVSGSRKELSGRKIAVIECDPQARKRIECFYIGLLDPPGNSQSSRRGKRPQPTGEEYAAAVSSLISEWLPIFRRNYRTVERGYGEIRVRSCGSDEFTLNPDIFCGGRDLGSVDGSSVVVSLVPWAAVGHLDDLSISKIQAATIVGYSRTSLIIVGRPERYFGVFVNERRKGFPNGWTCDEFLHPWERWEGQWYPDEGDGQHDPREPYDTKCDRWRLAVRQWDENGISDHVYCRTIGGTANVA